MIRNKDRVLRLMSLITLAGIVCCFFGLLGCNREEPSDMAKEIMATANSEVQALGYDRKNMTTEYDIGNRKWEDYAQSESAGNLGSTDGELESIMKLLKKYNFQVVYYAPKRKLTLGGDVWVFIDTDTKEVITTIRGK